MSRTPSSSDPGRIVVRGVNWLGDAVMTTPALRRLRERFPAAHIAMLTPDKLRDLWLHCPAINETISFAAGESVLSVAKKLRRQQFDLAVVFPNSPRSAIEVFLAGIPARIGLGRPLRNIFLTKAVSPRPESARMHKRSKPEIEHLISSKGTAAQPISPAAHQIYDYLQLVAAAGADDRPLPPQLAVTADEIAAVRAKFGLNTGSGPVIGLNPGAEYGPAKRWPERYFSDAGKALRSRTGAALILFGGKNDMAAVQRIHSAIGDEPSVHNVAGQTSLRDLMVLLKLCDVVVSNDTGPLHLAAALGTPIVGLYGSTSPELTSAGLPGDQRHRLLKSDAPCSPCFLRECPIDFRCMNGIQPGRVIEAALEILGK